MKENKILTFYQAVAASTTLQKKLTSALDLPEENQKMEAVLALAKEAGCPFTASEWQQAVAALGEYSDTKPASKEQPEVFGADPHRSGDGGAPPGIWRSANGPSE